MATEQDALNAIATLQGHVDDLKLAIETYIAGHPGAATDFQHVLDALAPVDAEVTETTGEVPAESSSSSSAGESSSVS